MFIIEFGPVGIFFLTYHFTDFLRAALALGLSTLIALTLSRLVNGRTPWFAICSGSITITTSLVTYFYNIPSLLIIRDSVFYIFFAIVLGVSMARGMHVFKIFFGHIFAITNEGWRILETRWLAFFVLASASNEYARIFLNPDAWVVYKQCVVIGFIFFGTYQFRVSMRFRLPEADSLGLRTLT